MSLGTLVLTLRLRPSILEYKPSRSDHGLGTAGARRSKRPDRSGVRRIAHPVRYPSTSCGSREDPLGAARLGAAGRF
jgi:hypothetical protein